MIKLGAAELRTTIPNPEELKKIKKNPICIILDNVMDTYNVGSIFRLADAVAAEKVILCGQTETPPHTRIKKASINTTEWMKWEYEPTAESAIKNLKFKTRFFRQNHLYHFRNITIIINHYNFCIFFKLHTPPHFIYYNLFYFKKKYFFISFF